MAGPNKAVRLLNSATAGGTPHFEAPQVDMERFDRLPPAVRLRVNENNTKMAAKWAADHLLWAERNGFGISRTISKIDEIERYEITVFAGQYQSAYQARLPHVAAGASIQRYGALGPSRHPPRRLAAPVIHRSRASRRRRRVVETAL